MKLEDFKIGIDHIKPDPYMETRLAQNVLEAAPKRRSKRKLAIAAVSGILSLAVLITGLGFGFLPRSNNDFDKMFVMSVRAADLDDGDYTPLDKDKIVLPDYKITAGYEDDGNFHIYGGSSTNFLLKGDNIQSVSFNCETGSFYVEDSDLEEYLIRNNEFYEIIVPYTEEYGGDIINYGELKDIMIAHIENGDYDEYFLNSEKKSADEYADVIYYIHYQDVKEYGIRLGFDIDETNLDDTSIVGVGIISNETNYKFLPFLDIDNWDSFNGIQHYTFQNLLDKNDGICEAISWSPNTNDLSGNNNMPLSKIPHDTITVEVTFKDGSVQTAKYDFSFNDSGELVIKTLA